MNKLELRKSVLESRKKVVERELKNHAICEFFLNSELVSSNEHFFIYVSRVDEVDTHSIIEGLLNLHKHVYSPVVLDERNMEFVEIFDLDHLVMSSYGILEPVGKACAIKAGVVVVPGVVFDYTGNRIGHGKGYYDRFLENKRMFKLGLCYGNQVVEQIDCDFFDVSMDCLLSEHGFWSIEKQMWLK